MTWAQVMDLLEFIRKVVVPIVVVIAPLWWVQHRRDTKAIKANSAASKEQVVNSHSTNLRDDLDTIRDIVVEQVRGVREDVAGIRDEQELARRETRLIRRDMADLKTDVRKLQEKVDE